MSLALTHLRFQFLETIRIPMAVIGNGVFPGLVLVFFVVPFPETSGSRVAATAAAAQLAVFAVLSSSLFTHGIGVAEDRAQPWDPYVRTLPAGPAPRMVGRVLNGLTWSLLGVVPVVILAALLTEASLTGGQLLVGLTMLLAVAVPFVLAGIAIGYLVAVKAAPAVAQLTMFPLAFGGGLFLPPQLFPGWMDVVSIMLPTRGARELVVWATTGQDPNVTAVIALAGWTVALAVVAAWAYRRDEGRRFS